MPRYTIDCFEDNTAGEMSKLLVLAIAVCDTITAWPDVYRRLPTTTDTNAGIRARAAQLALTARGYIVTLAPLAPSALANTAINQGEACALLGAIGDLATLPEVSSVNQAANDALSELERASILFGVSAETPKRSALPFILGGTTLALLGAALFFLRRRRSGRGLGDVDGYAEDWWRNYKRPGQRLCYRTKSAALQAFRDANRRLIEEWGGLDVTSSPAEFDAINHRHGDRLRGKKAITLAQAIWAAMPNGQPYCLDEIDIEALNDTSPGRIGSGFRLPDWAYEAKHRQMEEKHYARDEELEPAPF